MLSVKILVFLNQFYSDYVLSDSEYCKTDFLSFISGITEYTVNSIYLSFYQVKI